MRIQMSDEPVTPEAVQATLNMFFGLPSTPTADGTPVATLDPESIPEIGGSLELSSGVAIWLELDLEPGNYIVMCFLPSPGDPIPHAAKGMFKIFTVE
jgi:hypothetical protein